MRARWLVPALRLPGEVARDTVIVFAALWRRLARGEEPPSGFRELPVRYGDGHGRGRDPAGAAGRRPVASPRTPFVLGIDADARS